MTDHEATFASYGLEFVPQLLAAIDRHEEAQNWCTWDNVVNAAQAVKGDEIAQKHLAEDAPWQLDAEGRLPA